MSNTKYKYKQKMFCTLIVLTMLQSQVQCCKCSPDRSYLYRGQASCDGDATHGVTCKFTCDKGYELVGSSENYCNIHRKWDENKPSCLGCTDDRYDLLNGFSKCDYSNEIGSVCEFFCSDTYRLIKHNKNVCQPNREWDKVKPTCVKVCPYSHTQLEHGTPACNNENFIGSTCSYSCSVGYSLSHIEQVKCEDNGFWNIEKPQCNVFTCNPPSRLQKGHYVCSPNPYSYEYKTACEIRCEKGYKNIDSNKITCLENGWSNSGSCSPKICQKSDLDIGNGSKTCDGAENDNYVGSTCRFSCNQGFILKGSLNTTCQEDEKWNNPKPKCEEVRCPTTYLQIKDGNANCSDSNTFRSICNYDCKNGFTLDQQRHNYAICLENSTWNNMKPNCAVVKCNSPKEKDNGAYTCNSTSYEFGTICNLTCNEGYKLVGEIKSVCSNKSEWSESGTCQAIPCSDEYLKIDNGFVSCIETTKKNHYGSRCEYHCKDGYVLNGVSPVTCLQTGNWSYDKPFCEERLCAEDYLALEGGSVICKSKNQYKSMCAFSCDSGYQIFGIYAIECNISGQWNAPKPSCIVNKCETPEFISSAYISCNSSTYEYRTICNITCFHGYKIKGDQFFTCNANGGWSSKGNCAAINCSKDFTEIDNGYVKCTNNDIYDSRCNYTCYSGYILNGSHSVSCNSDGNWSNEKPRCEGRFCSVENLIINNGQVNCQGSKERHGYNSTCYFKCNKGYQLDGSTSITCNIDETWSSIKPECIAFNCSKPRNINGGNLMCNGTNYTYGTICHLSCNDGYMLIGENTTTCEENKHWSPCGSCKDIEPPNFPSGCTPPVSVHAEKVGQLTRVIYKYPNVSDNSGSIIMIEGHPKPNAVFAVGTTLVNITANDTEGNVGHCNFSVMVEQHSCGEPNLDTTDKLLIGYKCEHNYKYGDKCSLHCLDGNTISGSDSIFCEKSQNKPNYGWIISGAVNPLCNPKQCPKLSVPKNGALACNKLTIGREVCVPLCNTNFTTPSSRINPYVCSAHDGAWIDLPKNNPPGCVVAKKFKRITLRPAFYYYVSKCDSNNDEIKKNFLQCIKDANYISENDINYNITHVSVECYTGGTKRKKRESYTYEYKITATIQLGSYVEYGSPAETLEYYEHLANNINEHFILVAESGMFELPSIGVFNTIEYAEVEFECDPGEAIVYKTMSCAGCGPGFAFNNDTHSCDPCNNGYYQENEVSFRCIKCPEGTTTRTKGATTRNECQDLCKSGESSESGNKPCRSCPIGTYQPESGRKRCITCPFGMSTNNTGAESKQSCRFQTFNLNEHGPSPVIQIYNKNPVEFTFMMWVKNKTVLFKATSGDTASIVIDTFPIFLTSPNNSFTNKLRNWNHVALVYAQRTISMYINGEKLFFLNETDISLLSANAFRFERSNTIKEITVSGVQLTTKIYTDNDIKDFANSCEKQVDLHFLAQDPFNTVQFEYDLCNEGCGRGYYYNTSQMRCLLCDAGSYQNKETSTECIRCANGTTGHNILAISKDFCHTLCKKGNVFDMNTRKCTECPKGTYKDSPYTCTECPDRKTTNRSGSDSMKECHSMCEPGFYSPTGKIPCSPCPIGKYQPGYQQRFCPFCPYGMSTTQKGKSECQFFDLLMNSTHGRPKVKLNEINITSFSLMMRISTISNKFILSKSSFSFDNLSEKRASAYLTAQNIRISIKSTNIKNTNANNNQARKWIHLALLYHKGGASLFLNGELKESLKHVMDTTKYDNSFYFTESEDITHLIITHPQMSETAYSSQGIIEFVEECSTTVQENIFFVDSEQSTLLDADTCSSEIGFDSKYEVAKENLLEIEDTQISFLYNPNNINLADTSEKILPKLLIVHVTNEVIMDRTVIVETSDIEKSISGLLKNIGCNNDKSCKFTMFSQQTSDNYTTNTSTVITVELSVDKTQYMTDYEPQRSTEYDLITGQIIELIFSTENLGLKFKYNNRYYEQKIYVTNYTGTCQNGTLLYKGWCYVNPKNELFPIQSENQVYQGNDTLNLSLTTDSDSFSRESADWSSTNEWFSIQNESLVFQGNDALNSSITTGLDSSFMLSAQKKLNKEN